MTKFETLSKEKLEKFLNKENLAELHALKLKLDDSYYNSGENEVEDWRYDMLKDTLQKRDPNYVPPVGVKIREGDNRVTLPYYMGSATKFTPAEPDALNRWIKANPASDYVVSDKLDGVSCLLSCKNGRIKLFTRGDGIVGADISYLAKYFKTIPDLTGETIIVRGELIMKKETFENTYKGTVVNGRTYKNPRNMVSGLVGGKTVRKGLEDIDFVVYEVVGDTSPKPSKQLQKLQKMGFTVVKHSIVKNINVKNLEKLYREYKETSDYEIDGIIIQSDISYDRNTDGNPSYMFAFKMLVSENIHTTTVKSIEWSVSKLGLLKPVVIVEPVESGGVTISRATAHNAKYVEENNLGAGAVIQITRSKDVIPFIVSIVTPAEKPEMPEIPYTWDKNHVNILVVEYDSTMCVKLIAGFFEKLGIKHVSEATVRKLYDNNLNTLLKIIGASKERLAKVPGFQAGLVKRTYENIHNGLQGVKLSVVLGASNIFGNGIGRKRVDMLLLDIPDLLTIYKTLSKKQMIDRILNIAGFSNITADQIVMNLQYADRFIQKISKFATFKEEVRVSDSLTGKIFVFSGFRDKTMEDAITERGGKTSSSVSKNTSGVVVKIKDGDVTGKIGKAMNFGIPIYDKEEFVEKFLS